jgi:FeS assembly SUF system protein
MEGKPLEHERPAPASEREDKPETETAPAAMDGAVAATPASALPPEEDERLRADVIAALKSVYDPEIPADIYELGLIYDIAIDAERNVAIAMTLTAPACPVAGEMPQWVENAVNAVPGVASTKVTMTFDPPWDMSRMSDEARLALNMF